MEILKVDLNQYNPEVDNLKEYFIAKDIPICDSMFILAMMYVTACKILKLDRGSVAALVQMLYDTIIPSDEDQPEPDPKCVSDPNETIN